MTMVSQKVLITNPSGLHARPASKLIAFVKKLDCEILILAGGAEINCGSIIELLTAAIKQGTTVEVRAVGKDEPEALAKVVEFLENLSE
jgi:phosphotransferase system HPr (HPr) family protein